MLAYEELILTYNHEWMSRLDSSKRKVKIWQGYNINKYSFYTKSQDDKSIVQNIRVSLKAESQHFATVNDDNPRLVSMPYFGVIEEI